ncbi:MAG: arylesterase [Gammaproteobacteria bacterium]|nr:arylesterase [Gammaproteobacteria bacterium]NNM00115.1 arylesterase [Gammaproteobacteria bacterium]
MVSSPCGPVTVLPSSSVYRIINSLLLRWCLLLATIGVAAGGPPILPAFAAPPQRQIVILGDSLSAGYGIALDETWVAGLTRRLAGQDLPYRVTNASISGETSSGGLSRLPQLLETFAPDLVVIELGANDGLRGISLEELRRNLVASIELVQASGAGAVLVGMELPPNYGPAYQAAFRSVFADVAETTGVPLTPFILNGIATNNDLMQDDGLHPRGGAGERILDNLWPTLRAVLEERSGES